MAARYFPSIKHNHNYLHQDFPFSNTLVPPATTVPLDFTCYYQSLFFSFTSINFDRYFNISFRAGRLRLYLRYFLVDPCPIMCACVYLSMSVYNFFSMCLEVSTKLYDNTVETDLLPNLLTCQRCLCTQHSRSRSSATPLDLPIQNSDSVRFCSNVIPSHRP